MAPGYDVLQSSEADIGWFGEGDTYKKVAVAVEKRGVKDMAIYGHSYGGDATHDLSSKIKTDLAGKVTIQMTAYIDAVDRPNLNALFGNPQRELPPGSLYHINYYETISGAFQGAPTNGTTNNTKLNVDHFKLPWEPEVQSAIWNAIAKPSTGKLLTR